MKTSDGRPDVDPGRAPTKPEHQQNHPFWQTRRPLTLLARLPTGWESFRVEPWGRNWKRVYEPLPVELPRTARPYCCYYHTIIFYDGPPGISKEIDKVDSILRNGAWREMLVWIGSCWWTVQGSRVIYEHGKWWLRSDLSRNSVEARAANGELALVDWLQARGLLWVHRIIRPFTDALRAVFRPRVRQDIPPDWWDQATIMDPLPERQVRLFNPVDQRSGR